MRKTIFITISALVLFGFSNSNTVRRYILINTVKKNIEGSKRTAKVSKINNTDIIQLNEPLKALAAYYSALAGSNCDKGYCELTSALGLNSQGSLQHKALIQKWFPNDTVAKKLIAQNCFQSPIGSSTFTNYASLIFDLKNDTVIINFSKIYYNSGNSSLEKSQNIAIIKANEIVMIKR